MTEWKTIESAGETGAEVLVGNWAYTDDGTPPVWCQWLAVLDGGPLGCDWINGDPPTHWHPTPTPLPNAPEGDG